MESLVKLHHSSIVADYTSQFESLSNHLRGLSDKYKLSCFLSGLQDEIRLPLRMLAPRDLVSTFGLTKLQEEFITRSRKPFRSQDNSYSHQSLGDKPEALLLSWAVLPLLPSSLLGHLLLCLFSAFPPPKCASAEKGLCYNCDEKWNPSDKCKSPTLYLMQSNELLAEDSQKNNCVEPIDKS